MDALLFVKGHFNEFDVVIIDSTDPVDFARGLFEPAFSRTYTLLEGRGHDGGPNRITFLRTRFVARCC